MNATLIWQMYREVLKMDRSVLLLSGGVDSMVLLAHELACGRPPLCVSFDYGQRHRRELESAARIAAFYQNLYGTVGHMVITLPAMIFSGSALTDGELPPRAHYADPVQAVTVVPNRNMVFLSVAVALASQRGIRRVLLGAHQGDEAVYPDCRRPFVEAMYRASDLACQVLVEAPMLSMTKKQVVRRGRELNVPFDLAWSCYFGGEQPCGGCGACVERAEVMVEE